MHQRILRMHVLGNAKRRMQSDRVPDSLDVQFRDGATPSEAASGVSAVHFKAALTIMLLCSQADVVNMAATRSD